MKRVLLPLLLVSTSAYAATPAKTVAPRVKPVKPAVVKPVVPQAKPTVAPEAAPVAAPIPEAPVPTPVPEVASPTPEVPQAVTTPEPVAATPSVEVAPVAASPSVEVVAATPSVEAVAATPSLEVKPVAATASVEVKAAVATPTPEVKPALTATSSLQITNAKIEKTGGSLPLNFSMPSLPRLGLKIGYDMGMGQQTHRYSYGVAGGDPEVAMSDNLRDLAGKQLRLDWSLFGLGVGASMAGYGGSNSTALWPGQTQDLYATLPGLRFGYRRETFGTLSPADIMDGKTVGSLFGGLYSDGPLLVDALRFGYDVNLGYGMWDVPSNNWHLSGNGEAFLGIKLDWIGVDFGYRYAMTSGNAPSNINPMSLASSLLGFGEKPQVNVGTNAGYFVRTKIYW